MRKRFLQTNSELQLLLERQDRAQVLKLVLKNLESHLLDGLIDCGKNDKES